MKDAREMSTASSLSLLSSMKLMSSCTFFIRRALVASIRCGENMWVADSFLNSLKQNITTIGYCLRGLCFVWFLCLHIYKLSTWQIIIINYHVNYYAYKISRKNIFEDCSKSNHLKQKKKEHFIFRVCLCKNKRKYTTTNFFYHN